MDLFYQNGQHEYYSSWQLLDGLIEPEFFDGKITVVGTSASGLLI